jgi:hypothetical protein
MMAVQEKPELPERKWLTWKPRQIVSPPALMSTKKAEA